ncbi:MAG: hypothetical protein J6M19_06935 [Bacteroidaceae bacterium]|nr:hypothetical protein [Bacteroidaceae bacterium]
MKKEVEKSEKTLLVKRRNVTAGRVIAELNLGFWNSLYETHHYALLQGVPCTIFRGLPTGYGRKEVNAIIQDIRIMRNRVSHNEPLCFDNRQFDMTYVKQMYVLIYDFFTWINPNIIPTMAQEALDNVQAEIAKTEAIINS